MSCCVDYQQGLSSLYPSVLHTEAKAKGSDGSDLKLTKLDQKKRWKEMSSDSKDKGLHSYYGSCNCNSAGGYGCTYSGYPPVAYPYPPPQAVCLSHHHHSGHGGLGAIVGTVASYMMPHCHGHGGHYGRYHHGRFKHGKFGKHGKYKHKHGGGFIKWK